MSAELGEPVCEHPLSVGQDRHHGGRQVVEPNLAGHPAALLEEPLERFQEALHVLGGHGESEGRIAVREGQGQHLSLHQLTRFDDVHGAKVGLRFPTRMLQSLVALGTFQHHLLSALGYVLTDRSFSTLEAIFIPQPMEDAAGGVMLLAGQAFVLQQPRVNGFEKGSEHRMGSVRLLHRYVPIVPIGVPFGCPPIHSNSLSNLLNPATLHFAQIPDILLLWHFQHSSHPLRSAKQRVD